MPDNDLALGIEIMRLNKDIRTLAKILNSVLCNASIGTFDEAKQKDLYNDHLLIKDILTRTEFLEKNK